MAKRSVYIPDSLWEDIQHHVRDLNLSVSEIVQNALRQVINRSGAATAGEAPFDVKGPSIDADRLARLRERFQREAQAAYEDGARVGAELAERLTWVHLNALAKDGWRVPTVDRKDGNDLFAVCDKVLSQAWGERWAELLRAEPMRTHGLTDALQEVWAFVTAAKDAEES
jgi:hypothetical protein